MKSYQYKIQWLFGVRRTFVETEQQLRKRLFNTIENLGARSLTSITGRDENLKIVWHYSGMVGYPSETASKETIKRIKKKLKEDNRITSIELLRR